MSEPTQPSTPSSSPSPEPAQVTLTADVDAISAVFAKAPLEWNERDMERMIAQYRKDRKDLDAGVKKPKAEKAPAIDVKGLSTDDLLGKLGL